jgi:hypothetical protein
MPRGCTACTVGLSVQVAVTDSWLLSTTLYGMSIVMQSDIDLRCARGMFAVAD